MSEYLDAEDSARHHALFNESASDLARLGREVIGVGLAPDGFVGLVIDVGDEACREIADLIAPDADWEPEETEDDGCLAYGVFSRSVVDLLIGLFPQTHELFSEPLEPGSFRVLVIACGGFSTFSVAPTCGEDAPMLH